MKDKLESKIELLRSYGYTCDPSTLPDGEWIKRLPGVEPFYTAVFFTDDGSSVIPRRTGRSILFYEEDWNWRGLTDKEFEDTLIKFDEILKEKAAAAYNEEVDRILEVL